jgi:hypothetical protein
MLKYGICGIANDDHPSLARARSVSNPKKREFAGDISRNVLNNSLVHGWYYRIVAVDR